MGAFLPLLMPLIQQMIGKMFPNPEEQAQAQATLDNAQAKIMQAQEAINESNAQLTSTLTKDWLPYLMYVFISIIAFNYLIVPILASAKIIIPILPVPSDMWTLIEFCIMGHVGVTSVKHVTKSFNLKKFYDSYRAQTGGVTATAVKVINTAVSAAEEVVNG